MLTKLGRTGARGLRGPQGKTGPSMPRAAVLAIVDDQFTDIHKKLDIQLTRVAQLNRKSTINGPKPWNSAPVSKRFAPS